MLAPTQQQTTQTWPIPADAADLRAIVEDQAATVAANAILIDAYQQNLNAAQNVPGVVADGSGTGNGTQLAVTGSTAPIVTGAVVADDGNVTVPLGTKILGQISGASGRDGTYLTDQPTTASATALTFTPPDNTAAWPAPNDAPTLMLIVQDQLTVLRQQTALLQGYQTLLNDSETAPPATGP